MNQKKRKLLYILLSVVVLLILVFFGGNFFLKSKFEKALEKGLPENASLSYSSSLFDIFSGSFSLNNPELKFSNQDSSKVFATLQFDAIEINNLSYRKYLLDNAIDISEIALNDPKIYYHPQLKPKKKPEKKSTAKEKREVNIQKFSIKNGKFWLLKEERDSIQLYANNVNFSLWDINPITDSTKTDLPFSYSDYEITGDSVYVKLSTFNDLTFGSFSLNNESADIRNAALLTNVSEEEFSKQITKEQDHYTLHFPRITIGGLQIKPEDSTLGYYGKQLKIESPDLKIYRDKRVADDFSTKPMFGKMLRDLPFPLQMDVVELTNGTILYNEKIESGMPPGEVKFQELNARILNAGNTFDPDVNTQIHIDSKILSSTRIIADWSFKVWDEDDNFTFRSEAGQFDANKLNSFTIPSANLKLSGNIQKTFFTIMGNNNSSHVDLRVKYDDFKVLLLKDDTKEKKGLLSALVNIFVAKDSKTNKDAFREGSATVVRPQSKSVFNYIWKNILEGLKSSVK